MKKVLKIAGIILGSVLLLLLLFIMFVNFKDTPTYEVKAENITVEKDSVSLANGLKMATLICGQCHMGKNSRQLEGRMSEDMSGELGTVYSPNITKHLEKGIGQYSDGELAYLLRTGIKRNGKCSPPWMLTFPNIADEDLHDIIAFLRSDHPAVEASDKYQPAYQPSFIGKVLTNFMFKPLPYPEAVIKKPNESNQVALGKYLANDVYQCYGCHSTDFTKLDELKPELSVGFYGGGNRMKDLDGNLILTANITMHQTTGIGDWTEEQFIKAVKSGSRPDGTPVMYPMNKYTLMEDEEVAAIWAYLKTVPVIGKEVDRVAME